MHRHICIYKTWIHVQVCICVYQPKDHKKKCKTQSQHPLKKGTKSPPGLINPILLILKI
jgi:hypothetical protein